MATCGKQRRAISWTPNTLYGITLLRTCAFCTSVRLRFSFPFFASAQTAIRAGDLSIFLLLPNSLCRFRIVALFEPATATMPFAGVDECFRPRFFAQHSAQSNSSQTCRIKLRHPFRMEPNVLSPRSNVFHSSFCGDRSLGVCLRRRRLRRVPLIHGVSGKGIGDAGIALLDRFDVCAPFSYKRSMIPLSQYCSQVISVESQRDLRVRIVFPCVRLSRSHGAMNICLGSALRRTRDSFPG